MHYDVIVIGGGPSGLMAAIGAAEEGASVLLLDKGNKLGRKLAISGGGRCNVTNRLPLDEIVKHIPGNGRFLYSAFSIFNNEDIITFFENLGVKLKEEDHGRMFPVSNKAQSVVDALLTRLKDLGVKIRTNTPVETIEYENGQTKAVVLKTGEVLETNHVVIAVGGKSVPQTVLLETDMLGQKKLVIQLQNYSQQKYQSCQTNHLFETVHCKDLLYET